MNLFFKQQNGFTLFEVVIVIFILTALGAVVVAGLAGFQKKSELDGSVEEFANVLKLAQSKALSSESESRYGIYVNTSTTPDKYILFKGNSYALRITSYDQVYTLPQAVEFSSVSLGGGNEVVFERISGFSQQSGSVALWLTQGISQTKTVYISNAGVVSFTASATPADTARTKDSRHVHFDYSRVINTATENVVLTFNGSTVQTIPITSNLSDGQFYWMGTVTAGGSAQTVTIQTHRLNSTDTQFSIHRDRSLNNKTLQVTLSGDGSGSLATYSADGATVSHASIYVSNVVLQ